MTRARDVADTQDNVGGAVAPFVAGKNFVINGDMAIAQRSTSATSVTSNGFYCVDRFNNSITSLGTYTVSQEADGPAGFAKSFKTLVTTADAAPIAESRSTIIYRIEGDQVQSLAFGTSSAKTTTFSFWVKSNVTGTYIFEAVTGGGKDICASYSITQSGVWEKKIITFRGDVSDSIAANNNSGLALVWWLAAGSTYTSGTLNTSNWNSVVSANRAVGQTNFAAATNNYFQITGVQMELGSQATPFTTASGSIGGELALCQRYYQQYAGGLGVPYNGVANSTTTLMTYLAIQPTMRSAATCTVGGTLYADDGYSGTVNAASPTVDFVDQYQGGGRFRIGGFSGMTTGRHYSFYYGLTGYIGLSAEL